MFCWVVYCLCYVVKMKIKIAKLCRKLRMYKKKRINGDKRGNRIGLLERDTMTLTKR